MTDQKSKLEKKIKNAISRIIRLRNGVHDEVLAQCRHALVQSENAQTQSERTEMSLFDRFYNSSGQLKSAAGYSDETKLRAEVYFHHRDKSEIALTVGSSWYGGDYFEFGSHDLATFRNMLSAYSICAMTRNYPDVRFYAFDIFGALTASDLERCRRMDEGNDVPSYFAPYANGGDQIELHRKYIRQHNLYTDRCHLVQGLFENTLTPEFKKRYKSEKRQIGFAFLDCNLIPSYKTVFEFIFDLMAENSYIYMDEYFQCTVKLYQQFTDALRDKRGMGSVYVRNAGGFGALFRLYPLDTKKEPKLELKIEP